MAISLDLTVTCNVEKKKAFSSYSSFVHIFLFFTRTALLLLSWTKMRHSGIRVLGLIYLHVEILFRQSQPRGRRRKVPQRSHLFFVIFKFFVKEKMKMADISCYANI